MTRDEAQRVVDLHRKRDFLEQTRAVAEAHYGSIVFPPFVQSDVEVALNMTTETVRDAHPDSGGSTEAFQELTRARQEALDHG